jgi:N-methylhydantoinase A
MTARLGIDIGGTFTDFVLLTGAGAVHRYKCPSTPHDYAEAIGHGLDRILAAADLPAAALSEVLHGTTVASNAILEGTGARTGLITTRGFRDILEIRTLRMPRLYDLTWDKPPVLVERALRREVDERLDAGGAVRRPLDEASAVAALNALASAGVEAIAVCLLHSYANDRHERRIGELAAAHAPGIRVSLSVDVLPELREYERTSTTVINAYLQPVVGAYLDRLRAMLLQRGVTAPLLLMRSGGGLMPAEQAARRPVGIVESGPAAGVIGAMALARDSSIADLISFDMGGTTAKAALVTGGEASRAAEFQVGGGIMSGSRLLTGGGYTLRVPAIDLAEVGAGGGSVVWLDRAGAPQVGPHSAGAVPGPVCYGQGGTEPTVTDCALVLGWLGAAGLAGGAVRLDPAAARAAVQARIAGPLGMDVAAAAYGAVEVATATMIRAIRAVSSERGRDPRDFALVSFGGNGGIFGPLVARSLGMRRVVVPPSPGLFSASGLLDGAVEHQASRTHKTLLAEADPDTVARLLAALSADVVANLAEAGHGAGATLVRLARLRYHGQSFELTVPLPGAFDRAATAAAAEAFAAEHERTYGHRAGADEPVELVSLAVLGRGRPPARAARAMAADQSGGGGAVRRGYFGAAGWQDAVLTGRAALTGQPRRGPLIIEEYDATIVIPPDAAAARDAAGNVLIDLRYAA